MKRVFVKEEVCIGCRLCEINCIVEHSKSKDIIKAYKKEIPRPVSRVLVEEEGALSFALQCRHCDEPPCVEACMGGALSKDPKSGAVAHDKDKCVGCWMCIMVCPYGAIVRTTDGKKVASKCDLCPEREEPACVVGCPNEALSFEERQLKSSPKFKVQGRKA